MMRFAFIMLLTVFCLSAKANTNPDKTSLESDVPKAANPAELLTTRYDDQSEESSTAASFSKPSTLEPTASEATTSKLSATEADKVDFKGSSAGESAGKQSSLPLKKVSVSEASNWPFVLLTLLAMIICILLIAWIVKRFSGLTGLGGRDLKIVSAIAVGSRERVAVVEVKGEQFLIGATPHNISLLHHFSEEELIAADAKSGLDTNKAPRAFADKLQSILKQTPAADSESK